MGLPAEWIEKDSDDNASSVASKAAVAGHKHVVMGVSASFSGTAASKLLEIKFGTTVVFEKYITDGGEVITFGDGIKNPDTNELVSATLAASGTGGTVGKVAIWGRSEAA